MHRVRSMELSALDALASTGCVVSLPHKAGMQSSFPMLKKNYKFSKVLFFGKVLGKVSDYLIAVGIEESWTSGKKFFFCADGVSWGQLPPPTEADMAMCMKLPSGVGFTGDISHVYAIPVDPVPEGEEPPEEAAEPPKLTEEVRLAVLVNMLDMENAMAPAGALSMLGTGAVVDSPAFPGLPAPMAADLGSYVFINKPKPKDMLASSVTAASDFLTPASSLVPSGALCPHLDESTGVTTIRNLMYPGFVAYATAGTKTWGYCYCGTGEKNLDLAFMLP